MLPPKFSRILFLSALSFAGFVVVPEARCQNLGSFYGAGLSLYPTTQPKPTGWAAAAIEASTTAKVYSISEIDFTIVGGTVQTSARTGIATWLRAFGPVNLYGLATAGVATTGTASGGALAGGGLITVPISKKYANLYGVLGVRFLKTTAATETLIETGIIFGASK